MPGVIMKRVGEKAGIQRALTAEKDLEQCGESLFKDKNKGTRKQPNPPEIVLIAGPDCKQRIRVMRPRAEPDRYVFSGICWVYRWV